MISPAVVCYDMPPGPAAETWAGCIANALDAFTAELPDQARVLDLGCGAGRDCRQMRKRGFCAIGADVSRGMLREAHWRAGPPLIRCDMRHLPFASSSFDGAWLCGSLLHLPYAEAPAALREIRRVTVAGAPVFVGVIQGTSGAWRAPAAPGPFTSYHPDSLAALLQECGYAIQSSWTRPRPDAAWIEILARVA